MKFLSKITCIVLALGLVVALSSCSKDDETCYECLGFDDGTTSLEDLGTICEGDDDGSGGEVTEAALNEAVTLYEAFGGTCTKQ